MPWLFLGKQFTDEQIGDAVGFVYRITNLKTGKYYIGKKLFTKSQRKIIKGKRKKLRVTSDWESYWSSSDELKKDVASLGESNFKREILRLCFSRTELNYFEAKYQFSEDVIINDTYNHWIFCRVRRTKGLTDNGTS